MLTLAALLGALSGLHFVAPELDPATTIVTGMAMQVTHALICRFFAAQRGRSGLRWGVAGLLGGILTTTVLLVAMERESN